MKLKRVQLLSEEVTGEDELGNEITKDIVTATAKGNFMAWTTDEITAEGREYTKNYSKLLLKGKFKALDKIRVDNDVYISKTQIKLPNGWIVAHVKRYGNEN